MDIRKIEAIKRWRRHNLYLFTISLILFIVFSLASALALRTGIQTVEGSYMVDTGTHKIDYFSGTKTWQPIVECACWEGN